MLEQLACSLGRNDEIPNIELAARLCENEDKIGIREIVSGLKHKDKAIANDCIKVLYEIGERRPDLIAEYANDFIALLSSRNNRLVWGSMTALAAIADLNPDEIYKNLEMILSSYQHGSVITVDNSITVLAKLCKVSSVYMEHIFPLLIDHLKNCRPKEVPQHAERISICIDKNNINDFLEVLSMRKEHLSDSQKARIEKLEKSLFKNLN
jgi:hypothetical protein